MHVEKALFFNVLVSNFQGLFIHMMFTHAKNWKLWLMDTSFQQSKKTQGDYSGTDLELGTARDGELSSCTQQQLTMFDLSCLSPARLTKGGSFSLWLILILSYLRVWWPSLIVVQERMFQGNGFVPLPHLPSPHSLPKDLTSSQHRSYVPWLHGAQRMTKQHKPFTALLFSSPTLQCSTAGHSVPLCKEEKTGLSILLCSPSTRRAPFFLQRLPKYSVKTVLQQPTAGGIPGENPA